MLTCLQYIEEDAEGQGSSSDDDDKEEDEEEVGDAVPIDSLKIDHVYLLISSFFEILNMLKLCPYSV